MSLNLNSVDDLIFASEFITRVLVCAYLAFTLVLVIILWKDWCLKLKVTTIKLKVDELIDQLAYHLPITRTKSLYFKVLHIWQPKLLEVPHHFGKCVVYFTFEISVIDEYALFFVLKTNK
jgi:hypothetical protein